MKAVEKIISSNSEKILSILNNDKSYIGEINKIIFMILLEIKPKDRIDSIYNTYFKHFEGEYKEHTKSLTFPKTKKTKKSKDFIEYEFPFIKRDEKQKVTKYTRLFSQFKQTLTLFPESEHMPNIFVNEIIGFLDFLPELLEKLSSKEKLSIIGLKISSNLENFIIEGKNLEILYTNFYEGKKIRDEIIKFYKQKGISLMEHKKGGFIKRKTNPRSYQFTSEYLSILSKAITLSIINEREEYKNMELPDFIITFDELIKNMLKWDYAKINNFLEKSK